MIRSTPRSGDGVQDSARVSITTRSLRSACRRMPAVPRDDAFAAPVSQAMPAGASPRGAVEWAVSNSGPRPAMIDSAVRERSEALVHTLLESVRIASVSLTGEGIADQVGFLRKRLEGWGFAVEVHPTTSHPIVYAEAGPKDARFTWLLYGHYDVYPADEKQEGW